jgi:hypothetical protein
MKLKFGKNQANKLVNLNSKKNSHSMALDAKENQLSSQNDKKSQEKKLLGLIRDHGVVFESKEGSRLKKRKNSSQGNIGARRNLDMELKEIGFDYDDDLSESFI